MEPVNLARIQPQLSYPAYAMCQPIRRVACHHCGNIRKNQVKCVCCPQLYCKNCAEKIKFEHGMSVFADGCPVCKKLCCCADKTPLCTRKHHCYRKCPVSKTGTVTPSPTASTIPHVSSTDKFPVVPKEQAPAAGPVFPAPSANNCLPLDLLAAACEQFATSTKDEASTSTSVEDVSDMSSSSGEEESIKAQKLLTTPTAVDLARASSLPSSNCVADLAMSQPVTASSSPRFKAALKRPYTETVSASSSATSLLAMSLANATNLASSSTPAMLPLPAPFEWWRNQSLLLQQQGALLGASEGVSSATTPTVVWVPVSSAAAANYATVNASNGSSNSHINRNFSGASLADYSAAVAASAMHKRARLSPELVYPPVNMAAAAATGGMQVYDWVVRPSPALPSSSSTTTTTSSSTTNNNNRANAASAAVPSTSSLPPMYYHPLLSAHMLAAAMQQQQSQQQ